MSGMSEPTQQEGPPRGTDRWKEETKGIERVIDVVLTLDKAETAGTISDEAMVSEQAAREHLDMLADLGVIKSTKARAVTKYQPDVAYLRFKEVSRCVERYDRDTLLDKVEDIKSTIQDTEERYSVETPDELRSKAAREDTTIEEVQEFRKAASEWDSLLHRLDVLEEALERYDEFDRAVAEV